MDETVTESFEFGIDAENFGANEKSSHDTLEGLQKEADLFLFTPDMGTYE